MTTPTQTPVVGSIVFNTPTFQRPEDAAAFNALRAELAAAQEARQRAEEQVLSRIIGIATVGNIDGHEVIRRQSAIDVVRMVFAAIDAAREGK